MGAYSSGVRSFRPRLTQEEKSAETRRRLLDAAITCLVERGYSNTTTSEIAERAGLSRGAQLYHFPRKEELLISALEHLFNSILGEMREKVGRLTSHNDRRALAIDMLWEISNGRLMTAWIELVVASRTDAYLRESVAAANNRAAEFVERSFKEFFPRPAGAGPDYDLIPHLMLMLFDGMALGGKTLDPKRLDRVLTALKTFKF
jgi:AcrR family transcriptional regulator